MPQNDGHLGGLGSLPMAQQQAEKNDKKSARDHPGGAGDTGLARGRKRRRHDVRLRVLSDQLHAFSSEFQPIRFRGDKSQQPRGDPDVCLIAFSTVKGHEVRLTVWRDCEFACDDVRRLAC